MTLTLKHRSEKDKQKTNVREYCGKYVAHLCQTFNANGRMIKNVARIIKKVKWNFYPSLQIAPF